MIAGSSLVLSLFDTMKACLTEYCCFALVHINNRAQNGTKRDVERARIEKIQERLTMFKDAFNKFSEGKGFFNGDNIGFHDMSLRCFMVWLKVVEIIAKFKMLDENTMLGLVCWTLKFCSHEFGEGIVPNKAVSKNRQTENRIKIAF